jgi:DNA-binding NtrC family response regulator
MTKRTPVTLEQLTDAIERHKGSVTAAAAELGRTPQALYKRLDDNGLEIEVTGVVVRRKEAA